MQLGYGEALHNAMYIGFEALHNATHDEVAKCFCAICTKISSCMP